MSEHAAVSKLKGKFSGAVLDVAEDRGSTFVTVKKEDIVSVCAFMKQELGYNFLCDIAGVDYLGRTPRFELVYNLFNYTTRDRIFIKVLLEDESAEIETVSCVWGTANWLEREVWDLMGIAFANHPDLRRILMPADWEGHPLRKDYPVQGPDREPYQGRTEY